MIFSKAMKRVMMRPVSGVPGYIGSSTRMVVSVYSGPVPTKAQLDTIYNSSTWVSDTPKLNIKSKIAALGNVLLGTLAVSPVKINTPSADTYIVSLYDKSIIPTTLGTASFALVSFGDSDESMTAMIFVFELGLIDSGADMELKSLAIVPNVPIYLNNISLNFKIGREYF